MSPHRRVLSHGILDRSRMLRRALIAAVFIVVASCGSNSAPPSSGPSPAVPPQGGGILFIGNSLTTTNDLPAMIEQLARESGGTPIVTRTVAEGGFSLEDHWNRGDAQRVSEAWQIAWRRDARLPLYGPDGFHPSPAGTYLAALVMYQQISGRQVIGLPSPLASIDQETARVLQESASEANARFARP